MSVSSKAAGFVGMLIVTYVAFPGASNIWGPALWIMAALTMTVGNLTALRQTNIVRLLAYSSIAQAGFMLVPFAVAGVSSDPAAVAGAFGATVTYIAIYTFMNLGAFAVVIAGARYTRSGDIDKWAGLASYQPGVALFGLIFFLSLAGIPPLAGWYAKLVMFSAAIGGGSVWTAVLAVIAAVNAVIAFYYYARVVKAMWFDPVPHGHVAGKPEQSRSLQLALVITMVFVIAAGIYPPISAYFGDTVASIVGGG
jgi:NADH-quinone oxidoreductase subunit N